MNTEELTNLIIKELSKQHSNKDIARKVCEASNLSWGEAEELIAQVETQHGTKIAAKQGPLLIFLSLGP